MALAESVNVKFNADTVGFTNGLAGVRKGLTSLVKKFGAIAGITGFAVLAKKAMGLSADLTEVQNVVDTTFGLMSAKIDNFAKNALESFGLSELSAKKFASTMGAMLKSGGITGDNLLKMSANLTALTGDMASFYNLKHEEVFAKIRSGISGETEPLKQLGVNMSVANLEAYRMAQGIKTAYSAMNQAQQMALRYNYLLSVTSDAQGDFAKTSNTFSNQLSLLSENWNIFLGNLGEVFIGIVTPVIQGLNILLKAVNTVFTAFKRFFALLGGKSSAAASGLSNVAASQSDLTNATNSGIGATKNDTKATKGNTKAKNAEADAQKGLTSSFDKFNDITPKDSKSTGGGGGASGDGVAGGGLGFELDDSYNLDFGDAEASFAQFDNIIAGIIDIMQPTIDSFKRLNEALEPFKTFAWKGLQDLFYNLLVPIAKWTFGTGIPRFIDAISNGMQNINWSAINDGLNNIWLALAPFAINVGEGLLWFWENVLTPLGTWTMNNVVPLFLEILGNSITILNNIIEALKPLGVWLWESFLKPIGSFTGGIIIDVLKKVADSLKAISDWISKNKQIVETFAIVIGSFVAAWKLVNAAILIWNVIGVIATAVTTGFGAAIAFLTSPIGLVILAIGLIIAIVVLLVKHWDEVKKVAIDTWEKIKAVFSEWGKSISEWWANDIAPWFTAEKWGKLWSDVKQWFSDGWNNITEWWNNSAFVKWFQSDGAIGQWFTWGKWSSLWEDVKTHFSTGWNNITSWWNDSAFVKWFKSDGAIGQWFTWEKWSGLFDDLKSHFGKGWQGVAQAGVNIMVSMVNGIISLLNKIKFTVPDWVPGIGGSSWGINLPLITSAPQIKLAKGGLAYGEVTALVGDNFNARQDPEVISPLSKLKDIMLEALIQKEIINGGNGETRIVLTLENGEALVDMLVDPINSKAKNLGYKPVFSPI